MREKNLAGPHERMDADAEELPCFISYDLSVASNVAFKPEKREAAPVISNILIVPLLYL